MGNSVANIKNAAKNLEDVKEMNLSIIIKLMIKMGVCSRADLAKHTGLRQSTMTNIINTLISSGLVIETGNMVGNKGRRSIGIKLNDEMYKVIAVRITRTGYMVGRFRLNGEEENVIVRDIKMKTMSDIISGLIDALRELIKESTAPILGIGLALPGPLIKSDDRIIFMTGGGDEWKEISVRKRLEAEFNLSICVEHDANAGALAEWWYGDNSMQRGNYIYIAAGQGIGAGLIIDGKIIHGAIGTAGEIGHMCINFDGPPCECGSVGCLEKYCSVLELCNMVKQGVLQGVKTELKADCTIKDIAKAYKNKDPFVMEVYMQMVRYLSIGLVNVIHLYNPKGIILGDELPSLFPQMVEDIQNELKPRLYKEIFQSVSICGASLQRDPAFIGAAAKVVEQAFLRPSETLATHA